MDSETFSMYIAYDRIDSFSNQRFDAGVGIICDTLAAVYGFESKPSDFMPDHSSEEKKKEKKKVSPKQSFAMFSAFFTKTKAK